MTAAPGIVTSGTGPPNATVVVQPGMNVQPVVLVDANGNYVTTSGSTATAGYLADLTGSVNVSAAAAPVVNQSLIATSGSAATWQFTPIAGGGTGGTTATIARGNLGVAAGTVSTQTLGTATASITFSSIPAGYNLLRLVVVGASARATEGDFWLVQVNPGGGSVSHDLEFGVAHGTSATAAYQNQYAGGWFTSYSGAVGDMPGANATSGVAGTADLTIPDYAGTTFQKTCIWRSGYTDFATSTSDGASAYGAGTWHSTAAITSVTIATTSGSNLIAGTTAYLYLS